METYSTPVLTTQTKKGLNKYWRGFVYTTDNNYYTASEAWQQLADGSESKHIISAGKLIKGKNIGKANETSPAEQAQREVESAANKKRDEGYRADGEVIEAHPLPMLAHVFTKHEKKLSYPVFVQPKLDGVRCLSNGKTFWSRQGKTFLPDVINHLLFDHDDLILDGELILPLEKHSFQETITAVKKFRPELSPKLEFHVYDVLDRNQTFDQRLTRLQEMVSKFNNPAIKLVNTLKATCQADVLAHHSEFLVLGYEGTIIRNPVGPYAVGNRSYDLLKHKDFVDGEYTIVDVVEGTAKEEGCAIFVCVTPDDIQFRVRPQGTTEARQKLWADREQLINKQLTVKYQNLTDDGVPRFPVGITIRDYE